LRPYVRFGKFILSLFMGQDTGICLQSKFENLVEAIELCVLVTFVLLTRLYAML
jgi:hypothetical protein